MHILLFNLISLIALDGAWHLRANDDTRGGWLAVAVYLALCFLCWREVLRDYAGRGGTRRVLALPFWTGLSLGVTALAINKQLDLQTWFFQWGHALAESAGVADYRRAVQAGLVLFAALPTGWILAYLWKLARPARDSERLVLAGVAGLAAFIFLRTATLNHVNLIGLWLGTHRPMLAMELTALLFLCLAVWRNGRGSSVS